MADHVTIFEEALSSHGTKRESHFHTKGTNCLLSNQLQ